MAYPTITDLPSAPQRTQTPDAFSTTADAFVAALPTLVTEVNAAGDYIDTKTVSIGNDFQGTYSAGTTYTTGQSVLYNSKFYLSLVDSNTGNTPDSSPSQWVEIVGAVSSGGGVGTRDFTATGAITAGDVVGLLSDGTVSTITEPSIGTIQEDTGGTTATSYNDFDVQNNVIMLVYRDSLNSSYGTYQIGTISGSTITWGTQTVFNSANSAYTTVRLTSDGSNCVIVYNDFGTAQFKAVAGSISGTTATFGTAIDIGSGNDSGTLERISDTLFTVALNAEKTAYAISRSGTTLTAGTGVSYTNDTINGNMFMEYDSSLGQTLLTFSDNAEVYKMAAWSISGTTVTMETDASTEPEVGFDGDSNSLYGMPFTETATANRYLGVVWDNAESAKRVVIWDWDGSSLTQVTSAVMTQMTDTRVDLLPGGLYHIGNDLFAYLGHNSGTSKASISFITIIGGEPVFSGTKTFDDDTSETADGSGNIGKRLVKKDPTSSKIWYAGESETTTSPYSRYNFAAELTLPTVPAYNWVGMAEATVSDGATVTCTTLAGTNSSRTGLTTNSSVEITGFKVGTALSATEVLITGADK